MLKQHGSGPLSTTASELMVSCSRVRALFAVGDRAHFEFLFAGESIYGKHFQDEIVEELKFTARGIVGMANKGPGQEARRSVS